MSAIKAKRTSTQRNLHTKRNVETRLREEEHSRKVFRERTATEEYAKRRMTDVAATQQEILARQQAAAANRQAIAQSKRPSAGARAASVVQAIPTVQGTKVKTPVGAVILKMFAIFLGLAILYFLVSKPRGNPGGAGAAAISGLGSFAAGITSGSPLFKPTGKSQQAASGNGQGQVNIIDIVPSVAGAVVGL